MARAIIPNSDYESVEQAKAAVDRYIGERNELEALILPFHVKRLTGGEPELPFQIADTVLRNVRKNSPPTMLRVRIGTVLFSGQWISAFRLQAEIISMADHYCNRLKSAFG
jgi:hypothetical protein